MMRRLPFILLVVMAVVLGVATLLEATWGTAWVHHHVYGAWWFVLVWAAIAMSSLWMIVRRRLWQRVSVMALHLSFLVILSGALITSLTSRKGSVHLREGLSASTFLAESGDVVRLPYDLRFVRFDIICYPGTEAPADYRTVMQIVDKEKSEEVEVSMNRIHTRDGYRFYQASYDPDLQGSYLSVNYDPWGTPLTYFGYVVLALSMLAILVGRKGTFMTLLRHPLLRRGLSIALLLVLGAAGPVMAGTAVARTSASPLPVLSRQQADSMSRVQVIYGNRVMPFNTLSRDVLQKVYGRPIYCDFTSEQVLGGWMMAFDVWRDVPMIRIKSDVLRRRLHCDEYVSLSALYEGDRYRLQSLWEENVGREGADKLVKAIQETDEKVGLLLMLHNGTLYRELPHDDAEARLSESKVTAELLYNRIPFTKLLFMICLTLGILSFTLMVWQLLCGRSDRLIVRMADRVSVIALWGVTVVHVIGYGLRWYVSGTIPMVNGYETMLFVALCILLLSVALYRRFVFILPFGLLLSGFALLVSWLGQMNPQITPLMPVLNSPWLSSHVSFIMMSYALFAFIAFDALLALVLLARRGQRSACQVQQLTLLSRLLLYPAVAFLSVGIFLGAVWANVSWGRYWGWDPKEVWALVTMLLYGLAFHRESLPWLRRPRVFHLYMLLCFLSVLMTYFGVNYLLGGMHSYANG